MLRLGSKGVIALGIGQCVNWGVLYYAFAVLVLPLERELAVSTWVVAGAFSLALLMSAMLAPTVGRWADRDRGALVMQAAGFAAAVLLVAWTFMPTVFTLYLVWSGLGLCMAGTLYEPAFAIVGRAYDDPVRRLRALAVVTLFGGLASTTFLPLTAFLVARVGWRGAVLVLAAVLALSTAMTHAFVVRHMPAAAPGHRSDDLPRGPAAGSDPALFLFIATTFALTSLASAAFTSNLVPAFGERGLSPGTAALLGGLIGVMQLPGRALLLNGIATGSPARLLAVTLVLQAIGLVGVALASSVPLIAGGTMVFALGAGLTTLVRPHLVQTLFSSGEGGYLNGRIARHQQLARAAGPLAVAWVAGLAGYATVFAAIAVAFTVVALASQGVLVRMPGLDIKEETI